MELLYVLVIGAVAGWIAGNLMQGGGFGLIGNIIVGIAGSFIGGWLLGKMGVSLGIGGVVETILTAVIGAALLLFVVGLIKRS